MSEKPASKDMLIGGGAILAVVVAIVVIVALVRSQGIHAGPPPAVIGKGEKVREMEAEKAAQNGSAPAPPKIDSDATTVDPKYGGTGTPGNAPVSQKQ